MTNFYDGETIHAADLNQALAEHLQKSLNLSDLQSVQQALANLGLGDIAKLSTPVPIANGGTGATTVAQAIANLGISSGGGISTPVSIANGGTGATSASVALTNLGVLTAISNAIANQNLGTASKLNTPISLNDGGTGATTASQALTNLGLGGAAKLADPIPIAHGGTGATSLSAAQAALGIGGGSSTNVLANYSALRSFSRTTEHLVFLYDVNVGGLFRADTSDTTSSDNGGTIIVATDGTRWKRQYNGPINVRWFGATGNGSSNDTSAIQSADSLARSISGQVYIPSGTYMVSQLTVFTGSNWVGEGREATIIKQISGSNTDLIYGYSSSSNWTASSPGAMVHGYTLRNITLDGNYNSGSGNTSGDGIAVYGSRPILQNLFIKNVAGNGLRTGYRDNSTDLASGSFRMEGNIFNIHVDTVGQHGWWNDGPHDTYVADFIVADASQQSNGGYYGFYFDTHSGTVCDNIHAWSQGSPRMKSALYCDGYGHQFVNSAFEGLPTGPVVEIVTNGCVFSTTCAYYAAGSGAVTIQLSGSNCSGNDIRGVVNGPGSSAPACTGLVFSNNSSDYIEGNVIELHMNAQEAGNVQFGAGDQGRNAIMIYAYNATSATYNGTVNGSDRFQLYGINSGGIYFDTNIAALKGGTTSSSSSLGHTSNSIGVSVALSNASPATLTSVSLSAGTWEIWGVVEFGGGSSTTVGHLTSGIATSASIPAGNTGLQGNVQSGGGVTLNLTATYYTVPCGPAFVTVSSNTTYYLVAESDFSGSITAGGYIAAKQIA